MTPDAILQELAEAVMHCDTLQHAAPTEHEKIRRAADRITEVEDRIAGVQWESPDIWGKHRPHSLSCKVIVWFLAYHLKERKVIPGYESLVTPRKKIIQGIHDHLRQRFWRH